MATETEETMEIDGALDWPLLTLGSLIGESSDTESTIADWRNAMGVSALDQQDFQYRLCSQGFAAFPPQDPTHDEPHYFYTVVTHHLHTLKQKAQRMLPSVKPIIS